MGIVIGINRGDNVVGLQPDDRMPHDWLRMVARVFTSYSAQPLQESIAAYIDGLNLTAIQPNQIGISDGMAFVDDQFIGFLDTIENIPGNPPTQESTITLDLGSMIPGKEYWVVLCYTWVNIMPPMKPSFNVIDPLEFDNEHHLKLGTVTTDGSTIVVVDDKLPWLEELLQSYMMFPRQATMSAVAVQTDFLPGFDCNPEYIIVTMNGLELKYDGGIDDDYELIGNDTIKLKPSMPETVDGDVITVHTILTPAKILGEPVVIPPAPRYLSETFTGDGSNKAFPILGEEIETAPVFVNGVRVVQYVDYTLDYLDPDTTLSMTIAPANGSMVIIDYVS